MKPLIWRDAQNIEPDGHALFDNSLRKTDSYIFMGGKSLPNADIGELKYSQDPKDYDLIYTYRYSESHLKRFDCFPNTGQSPLVNRKVVDILNKLCPDDIQAFPATILPEPNSFHKFKNHDYWVINITKSLDAIDKEESNLKYFSESLGGLPFGAKKLRLKPYEDKYYIARDKTLNTIELVSPALVQALKEVCVTGVEFIEDKDYGH